MNTLTSTSKNVMPYLDSYGITLRFPTVADAVIPLGCPVKLTATGEIAPIALVTDIVIGYVIVPSHASNEFEATILTKFRGVVRGQAEGIVATGALLQATTLDGATKLVNWTAGAANATGIAIKGGADNAEITVGLL